MSAREFDKRKVFWQPSNQGEWFIVLYPKAFNG